MRKSRYVAPEDTHLLIGIADWTIRSAPSTACGKQGTSGTRDPGRVDCPRCLATPAFVAAKEARRVAE